MSLSTCTAIPGTGFQPASQPSRPSRPPLSEKRLAANRANAKKSTGPRTPEGKKRSSKNALKHGICSTLSHLPTEDDLAFQTFVSEMPDTLHPKTPLQQPLFDQIVSTRWRLDRLAEAQSHLFTTELQKLHSSAPLSPSHLLALRFSDDKNNGFILTLATG